MKIILVVILLCLTALITAPSASAITIKNYVQWWPSRTTPWVYDWVGNVKFLTYNRSADYNTLKADFNAMITTHKPDLIKVLFTPKDVYPLLKAFNSSSPYPENNVPLDSVRPSAPITDYFDDLIYLANQNGIEVQMFYIIAAYGGGNSYPFSYEGKAGWFWDRPGWDNGYANPQGEAMRHPPMCNAGQPTNCITSSYNWIEHGAGYARHPTHDGWRHWAQTHPTESGVEDTGIGIWPVYETQDMVYNGMDTIFGWWAGATPRNLHSPIPSYSSSGYQQLTQEHFSELATHFKNKDILGYTVFQEPTYSHLRENMDYASGNSGNTEAGDARQYEVDYSPAEKAAYNAWRAANGQGAVSSIPYPSDSDTGTEAFRYRKFRQENLSNYLNLIEDTIRAHDPNHQVELNIFYNSGIKSSISPEVGYAQRVFSKIQPEILQIEGDNDGDEFMDNATRRAEIFQAIQNTQGANQKTKTFISFYNELPGPQKDQEAANKLAEGGFTTYYAPALIDGIGDGWPHWHAGCVTGSNCTWRLTPEPGTPAPAPMPTGDPSPTPRPGDINHDGKVDGVDYGIFFTEWDKTVPPGDPRCDFDGNLSIDSVDYVTLFQNWDEL